MARGLAWLERRRRPDGGWAPHPAVRESTWVTALAVKLLAGSRDGRAAGGVRWLLKQEGAESRWLYRLVRRLHGAAGDTAPGWSWYPGTAAWVAPTAFTLLALEAAAGELPEAAERIALGRRFLLARVCRDSGWNYGTPNVLGVDAPSYPETTGVALLALTGESAPAVARALTKAEAALAGPVSAQAFAWLTLALAAHNRRPAGLEPPSPRNVLDTALLALAAAGPHVFLRGRDAARS